MRYGCLQTTFCVFNAIIAVLAAACIGVGIWALADNDNFMATLTNLDAVTKATTELDLEFPADQISNMAVVIIVIGSVIMIIAGIGCLGALKNVRCLLGVFFITMVLICIMVIVVVVFVRVTPGKFSEKVAEKFREYLDNDKFEAEVKKYQKTFECCGINGPQDFVDAKKPLPKTCKTHQEGCVDKLLRNVQNVTSPLFIVFIITLVVLILATATSGYLYFRGDGQSV